MLCSRLGVRSEGFLRFFVLGVIKIMRFLLRNHIITLNIYIPNKMSTLTGDFDYLLKLVVIGGNPPPLYRLRRRQDKPALPLLLQLIQPVIQAHNRRGIRHPKPRTQRVTHQGSNLGHGRSGKIPGNHACVLQRGNGSTFGL